MLFLLLLWKRIRDILFETHIFNKKLPGFTLVDSSGALGVVVASGIFAIEDVIICSVVNSTVASLADSFPSVAFKENKYLYQLKFHLALNF